VSFGPRAYLNAQDIDRMESVLVEGRRAAGATYYVHVGDLRWWLYYLLKDENRREIIYLWDEEPGGDRLIGWSLLSPGYRAFDVFLHPRYAATGGAENIWTWTEEQLCEVVRRRGGGKVRTMWVGEHDDQLVSFLEAKGFSRAKYHMLYMTRSLDQPVPTFSLPAGFKVHHLAGEHQVTERAAVAHAAFGSKKPFELYRRDYLAFMRSPVYDAVLDLVVAAPDGRFGAFCICWLDPVNRVGLFEPVGTGPDFRKMGLGKALLSKGLQCMEAVGMVRAMVCVEHDNLAAQALYASLGFRLEHRVLTFSKSV
jgi:mycothiol synthase